MRFWPIAVISLFVNWTVIYWLRLRRVGDRVLVERALTAPEFPHEPMRKKPVVVLMLVLGGFLAGLLPRRFANHHCDTRAWFPVVVIFV
ncbi:MAG TPA: hypothetical protein VFT47_11410 [Vicinamibacterales bacterium]|nr:hypothetical protein [Vicinamibacterales bacterium]